MKERTPEQIKADQLKHIGNQPAFPNMHEGVCLTKREYFAAMAMQGLVNHFSDRYEYASDGSKTLIASAVQQNAERAVRQADALIEALNAE